MIKITFMENDKVIAEDELTDEQVKALNTELELASYKCPVCGKVTTGIAGWLLNAIGQKARQKIDEIVEKSGRGSRYTPITTKLQIIKDLSEKKSTLLKGAKQKQAEIEAKMNK